MMLNTSVGLASVWTLALMVFSTCVSNASHLGSIRPVLSVRRRSERTVVSVVGCPLALRQRADNHAVDNQDIRSDRTVVAADDLAILPNAADNLACLRLVSGMLLDRFNPLDEFC